MRTAGSTSTAATARRVRSSGRLENPQRYIARATARGRDAGTHCFAGTTTHVSGVQAHRLVVSHPRPLPFQAQSLAAGPEIAVTHVTALRPQSIPSRRPTDVI